MFSPFSVIVSQTASALATGLYSGYGFKPVPASCGAFLINETHRREGSCATVLS